MSLSLDEKRSSVKEIITKCNEMISDAEQHNLITLGEVSAGLKVHMQKLEDEFEKDDCEQDVLNTYKSCVEQAAIVLEYQLQAVNSKYRDVYSKRMLVETTCNAVMERSAYVRMTGDQRELLRWSTYASDIMKLKRRSINLLFDLTEDDKAKIAEINKALKE